MNRVIFTIVLSGLLAIGLCVNAQVLVQRNGISLLYREKYVNTIQCGNRRFDQYEVTAFLENRSGHTIDINGYCNVDHIFYSNGFDYSPCRAPFPGGVTFDPKSNWPNNSTDQGAYHVLVPAGNKLPAPVWNLAPYQFKDITNTPLGNTQPPSVGSPPPNSGGNYTYRPPANSGNKYTDKPGGSQPRGIPYGNDLKCLNCGNEIHKPLPPPASQSTGIPYGNAKTYGNLTMIASTAGAGPANQKVQPDKNEKAEDDELSKIDMSNPEEVAKWTIREMDKMAQQTKCPATAAAYKKLADYLRCTLKGGNCGPLISVADIPECIEDF